MEKRTDNRALNPWLMFYRGVLVTRAQQLATLLHPTLPLMCLGNPHKSNIWFHHLMKSKYLASDFREEAHNHTICIFGWTYLFNRLYTVLTPHPATTSFLLVHLTPSYYGSYTTLSITAHHLTLHTHLTALFKGQLQSIDVICHPLSYLI